MKERIAATHFIEVWKGINSVYNTLPMPILYLQLSLDNTYMMACKTIAIWKIKLK